MAEIKEDEEARIEFVQHFDHFEFAIGYSYTDSEKYPHLIWINFMFWSIDFIW